MTDIARGDLFRDAKSGLFGHPADWIVDDIFVASDGNEYARLCLVTNRHERKTLSLAILNDKHRFIRVRSSAG